MECWWVQFTPQVTAASCSGVPAADDGHGIPGLRRCIEKDDSHLQKRDVPILLKSVEYEIFNRKNCDQSNRQS